jgi:hypothetical protein
MSNLLGCSLGAIRKYEAGDRKIPVRLLARLMALCVKAGLIDLSNEIEDLAIGNGSSTRFNLAPSDDPLHALLNLVIERSDRRTLSTVSNFLEMVAQWNTTEAARRQKTRLLRIQNTFSQP